MLTMAAVNMSYHHIVGTAHGGERHKLANKKKQCSMMGILTLQSSSKLQDGTCAVLSSWSNAWVIYLSVKI